MDGLGVPAQKKFSLCKIQYVYQIEQKKKIDLKTGKIKYLK